MFPVLAALFLTAPSEAAVPFELSWCVADSATEGRYDYTFRLEQTASFDGYIDWIIFGDAAYGAPAVFSDFQLSGSAPAPYTSITSTGGGHNGPTWLNNNSKDWNPTGVGDGLAWTGSAANLVTGVPWSNLIGTLSPAANFEAGVYDCDLCDGLDEDGDGIGECVDPCPDDAVNDTDGDGVCESVDACLGDDATGDTDGDDVCDDIDACAGDDATGDTDGDDVCDDSDTCAGDDASGDTDDDGVCDDSDACAGDDASGDTDGDDVCDDTDVCAGSDASGDADGDGVCDDSDACAEGDDGVDGDGDDLADACDPCPASADHADSDGDGFLACADDCDDANADVHPEAEEACDEIDNDCDGTVDTEVCDKGCSTSGGAVAPWLALLPLLAVVGRRRR